MPPSCRPPALALLAVLALALLAVFVPLPALAQGATAPSAAVPAPLAAEGCLGCHGARGAGAGAVPGLAGRDRDELLAIMAGYRAGTRPATIMDRIVRGYAEAEVAAAVDHFSRLR